MPLYTNPAEFLLDLTNLDFSQGNEQSQSQSNVLITGWLASTQAKAENAVIYAASTEKCPPNSLQKSKSRSSFVNIVLALLHRSFIKSYRDVVTYGIRFVMYIGKRLG